MIIDYTPIKGASLNEVKLYKTVMNELIRVAKLNPRLFTTNVTRGAEVAEIVDESMDTIETRGIRTTSIRISFTNNSKEDILSEVDSIVIRYHVNYSKLYLNISGSSPRNEEPSEIYLAFNKDLQKEYMSLKKDIFTLYNIINKYWWVDREKIKFEKLESFIYSSFPTLVDNLIIGSPDDQEGNS